MKVSEIMHSQIIAAAPGDSLREAQEKIKGNGIRHLPVLGERGQVVGVVTDRDIKGASASGATDLEAHELNYILEKLTLDKIMSREVITGTREMSVPVAAGIMYENRVGCLLITEDEKLLGIVTTTDMLKYIAEG